MTDKTQSVDDTRLRNVTLREPRDIPFGEQDTAK